MPLSPIPSVVKTEPIGQGAQKVKRPLPDTGSTIVNPPTSKKRPLKKSEENFEPIERWWEKPISELTTDRHWAYLEHHGVMFSPSYEPHGVAVRYCEKSIVLPPEAEEVANFWCGVLESDYAHKQKFIDNYWKAFLSKLPSSHIFKTQNAMFKDVDFTPIKQYLDEQKQKKKDLTKEEKEVAKRLKDEMDAPYAFALVDWIREKIGNSKVEPPTLFRGRGEHPKQGMLKARIFPEDVTLNCSEDAPVPRVDDDLPGHAWHDVYHDNTITWLCFYKDSINDQYKYTYLAAQSKFKGLYDFFKYEKARKLKNYVESIRDDYKKKMNSPDMLERQFGTATYLIDFLALRAGGEKDTDEEADTVGCCSLRVEHISFNHQKNEITLDFLGKDSIRYFNTIQIDHRAFQNMFDFCKNKKPDDDIFDKITTSSLNAYLKELMPGLSAKVFRTYNASITLQNELDRIQKDVHVDQQNPNEISQFFNDCNRQVAILCNHQRSIPKQYEASMQKLLDQIENIKEDIRECQEYLIFLKKAKGKFKFVSKIEKTATETPRKSIIKESMKEDVCQRKMLQLITREKNLQLKLREKENNKTVALGTSKINYMDPRITVAFCKKYEMPIEKVFNRSLRLKFPWAMFAPQNYVF